VGRKIRFRRGHRVLVGGFREKFRRKLIVMGKEEEEPTFEELLEQLKDEDKYVRLHAVEALGELGDKKAIEPLFLISEDEEEERFSKIQRRTY